MEGVVRWSPLWDMLSHLLCSGFIQRILANVAGHEKICMLCIVYKLCIYTEENVLSHILKTSEVYNTLSC